MAIMTANKFKAAVAAAKDGDVITYFTGHLAMSAEFNSRIRDLANTAWEYAQSGIAMGTLVQRKNEDAYDYLFIINYSISSKRDKTQRKMEPIFAASYKGDEQ